MRLPEIAEIISEHKNGHRQITQLSEWDHIYQSIIHIQSTQELSQYSSGKCQQFLHFLMSIKKDVQPLELTVDGEDALIGVWTPKCNDTIITKLSTQSLSVFQTTFPKNGKCSQKQDGVENWGAKFGEGNREPRLGKRSLELKFGERNLESGQEEKQNLKLKHETPNVEPASKRMCHCNRESPPYRMKTDEVKTITLSPLVFYDHDVNELADRFCMDPNLLKSAMLKIKFGQRHSSPPTLQQSPLFDTPRDSHGQASSSLLFE